MGSKKTWFDLLKAGKSGLIAKKVQVTRNGKTFMQTVYVQTGQDPAAQQKPKAQDDPKTAGSFSMDEFDKLRGNKPDALRYLDSLGITWEKTNNPGVNWMRAVMAAKKAGVNMDNLPAPKTPEVPKEQQKAPTQTETQQTKKEEKTDNKTPSKRTIMV